MVSLRRRRTHESRAAGVVDPIEADPTSSYERLGDLLIRNNLVGRDQLAEALLRQDATGKRLGQVLADAQGLVGAARDALIVGATYEELCN